MIGAYFLSLRCQNRRLAGGDDAPCNRPGQHGHYSYFAKFISGAVIVEVRQTCSPQRQLITVYPRLADRVQ